MKVDAMLSSDTEAVRKDIIRGFRWVKIHVAPSGLPCKYHRGALKSRLLFTSSSAALFS